MRLVAFQKHQLAIRERLAIHTTRHSFTRRLRRVWCLGTRPITPLDYNYDWVQQSVVKVALRNYD